MSRETVFAPSLSTAAGHVADVLVIPASNRTQSVNRALARRLVAELSNLDHAAAFVDLRDHPMPLYDGDIEDRDGIPLTALTLARRIQLASSVILVSPEYNGSFSPLLKNTIDWLSRLDQGILSQVTVALASASPGAGGGSRGLQMVADWLANMRVDVAPRRLSIPGASLDRTGELAEVHMPSIAEFSLQAVPMCVSA